VAQAVGFSFMFARDKLKMPRDWPPSRLFIYYYARTRIGAPTYDGGCYIRDAFDVLRKQGAPPESYWPYRPVPSDYTTWEWKLKDFPAREPSSRAALEAEKHQALVYQRLNQDLLTLKSCLHEGYPFVFGTVIYSNFYDTRGNPLTDIPMPTGNAYPLGGHAMSCVGYDDARNAFLIRNSWGDQVGEHGHHWFPYAYMLDLNLTDDIWVLRSLENRVAGLQ
jgi:C1A family cysteine protease